MNASMPTPEGVIRNIASTKLILISLAMGFLFNILPWQGTYLLIRPDVYLLVLIFWSIEEPRKVGASTAFFSGLMMDIAGGYFFGQNALVYSISAYIALQFRLRILGFNLIIQALHIFVILFLGQALLVLEFLIVGVEFPDNFYFLRSLIGMCLWPIIALILELPRRQAMKDEIA
jgi:rod shape-determining protein MreD